MTAPLDTDRVQCDQESHDHTDTRVVGHVPAEPVAKQDRRDARRYQDQAHRRQVIEVRATKPDKWHQQVGERRPLEVDGPGRQDRYAMRRDGVGGENAGGFIDMWGQPIGGSEAKEEADRQDHAQR